MERGKIEDIAFDESGLVPCIVQEWRTGEVLMFAWMSREAVDRTLETGYSHFYSRSRDRLWRKGETSGNVQRVRELRYDCDADVLLALVEAAGPACHTGERTCFHRAIESDDSVPTFEVLTTLSRILTQRHSDMPEGSYTASLLSEGAEKIGAKVAEEAAEAIRAGRSESDERLSEEAADLIYHLGVLLESRDLSFEEALVELARRMG